MVLSRGYTEQIERIDRLLEIINSTNPEPRIGELEFDDLIQFAIQCMWHIKDWLLNDPQLSKSIKKHISEDIHSRRCLLICSDLANGTKHMTLRVNKTGFRFIGQTGIHVDGQKDIFMKYYEIYSEDASDPYYLMEIRDLLAECRQAWSEIGNQINKMIYEEYIAEHVPPVQPRSGAH